MSIAASSGDRPRPDRSHRILSLAEARSGVPEPATDTIIITFADAASHLQTCFFIPHGHQTLPHAVWAAGPHHRPSLAPRPVCPCFVVSHGCRPAAAVTPPAPQPCAHAPRRAACRGVGLWFLGCWLQYLSASAVFQPPSSPLSLLFFIFAPYYIYRQLPL